MQKARPLLPFLLSASLLFAGAWALAPLDRQIRLGFGSYFRGFQEEFEKASGYHLSYEGLSPSVLLGLSARRLELRDGAGRLVMAARKAGFGYDLLALVARRGAPFITGISLEGVTARLEGVDLERIGRLFGLSGEGGSRQLRLPPLTLSGRDLSLELPDLVAGGLHIEAKRVKLDATLPEPSIEVAGSLGTGLGAAGPLVSDFTLDGNFKPSLDSARLRARFSATGRDFSLRGQDFDLAYDGRVFEVRKARDSAPLDLYGRWEPGAKTLSLALRCDRFRPESLFVASGELAFLRPWFRELWTGSLSLSFPGLSTAALAYDIDLSGAIPETVFAGGWNLGIRAKGDPREIEVSEARARGPEGLFSFTGSARLGDRSVLGRLKADALLLGGRLPLRTSLTLQGAAGAYSVTGDSIELAGVAFRNLGLNLEQKGGSTAFTLAVSLPASSPVPVAPAPVAEAPRLEVEGSYLSGKQGLLECSLDWKAVEGRDFAPLLAAFLPADLATLLATVSLKGGLLFRSDFAHLAWSTTDLAFGSSLAPGLAGSISASGNDREVKVRKAGFVWQGFAADMSGDLSIGVEGDLAFDAVLHHEGVPYAFQGRLIGGNLAMRGDYGLAVKGWMLGRTAQATVEFADLPLAFGNLSFLLSTESDLRFVSTSDWELILDRLAVQPVASGIEGLQLPSVELTGLLGPQGGKLSAVRVFDAVSKVEGTGSLAWSGGAGAPTLRLELGGQGGESYSVEGGLVDGHLDAALRLRASPVIRFVKAGLVGSVDGDLLISGPPERLEAGFRLQLQQGRYEDLPLLAELNGSLAGDLLKVTSASFLWKGYSLSALAGSLDLVGGVANLAGHFESRESLAGLKLDFSATARTRAAAKKDYAAFLADCRFEGRMSNLAYHDVKTAEWPFVLDLSPRGTRLEGGSGGELVGSLQPDGTFAVLATKPFPLQVDLKGRLRGQQIDAEARGISMDVSLIVDLAGGLPVAFSGGTITGDLLAKGPAVDPEFSGALRLENCSLSMPGWINESAGPLSAPVVIDGKRLFLQAPSVPILSSQFALTLEMDFDGWIPNVYKIGLRSLAGTSVPVDTRILGITVKGYAIPNLDLEIAMPVLKVRGDLVLDRTDVTITPETLMTSSSGGYGGTLLDIDLAITFGKNDRVFFPDHSYPVVAGNTDPSSRLTVRYDPRGAYTVKGDINLRGGDAFYIQRNFFLKSARIRFNENSEKDFDPLVTMNAELRDSLPTGPIIVTLSAENAPIRTFKPRLSSDPTMSESDIALYLGQGLLGLNEQGGLDARKLALSASEFFPVTNVTKVFETRIRQALNLDVLYLHSSAVQRLLLGYIDGTSQEAPSLSDYLRETSLYAGKYLSDSIFLHGSARLDADPLVGAGSLGLNSEIGVDFETPFGLLQWTFRPQHPEQLFIDDQSLSLTWRLAF